MSKILQKYTAEGKNKDLLPNCFQQHFWCINNALHFIKNNFLTTYFAHVYLALNSAWILPTSLPTQFYVILFSSFLKEKDKEQPQNEPGNIQQKIPPNSTKNENQNKETKDQWDKQVPK